MNLTSGCLCWSCESSGTTTVRCSCCCRRFGRTSGMRASSNASRSARHRSSTRTNAWRVRHRTGDSSTERHKNGEFSRARHRIAHSCCSDARPYLCCVIPRSSGRGYTRGSAGVYMRTRLQTNDPSHGGRRTGSAGPRCHRRNVGEAYGPRDRTSSNDPFGRRNAAAVIHHRGAKSFGG